MQIVEQEKQVPSSSKWRQGSSSEGSRTELIAQEGERAGSLIPFG